MGTTRNLNLMRMGLREIVTGIGRNSRLSGTRGRLPWIYANKAPKWATGKSQPCLFMYDFVYRPHRDFQIQLWNWNKTFPFRYFIQLIMFEMTSTYFFKATWTRVCVYLHKLCIMVSVRRSCLTGRCEQETNPKKISKEAFLFIEEIIVSFI